MNPLIYSLFLSIGAYFPITLFDHWVRYQYIPCLLSSWKYLRSPSGPFQFLALSYTIQFTHSAVLKLPDEWFLVQCTPRFHYFPSCSSNTGWWMTCHELNYEDDIIMVCSGPELLENIRLYYKCLCYHEKGCYCWPLHDFDHHRSGPMKDVRHRFCFHKNFPIHIRKMFISPLLVI